MDYTLWDCKESDVTEATACVHAELVGWRGGVVSGHWLHCGDRRAWLRMKWVDAN